MASTIKIKRSSVAAKVPTTADINTGELALNITDRKLYSSNGTTVFEIGTHKLSVSNAAAIYQTKAIERSALANTNLRINLINTNLTSTNTAIRALDTAKLSVANAVAIYQTKAIERSALANTNLAITNVKTGLTTTNTALRTLISDRLQVANAATLYTTKSNPTTSGLLAHTGRATISTNLAVSGNTTISGLIANGVLGTSNYVLRTNGTSTYWAPASAASPGLVSLTTVAVKDLTQNDNVVTAAQVVAAQSYLQVANAVALYTTKSNPTTSGLLAHTGRVTISTNLAVTGNTVISAATTSGNNATGALLVTGGIGVGDSLYVKSRIGIANTSSVSVVYMTYNNTTKSLDTTFG